MIISHVCFLQEVCSQIQADPSTLALEKFSKAYARKYMVIFRLSHKGIQVAIRL